MLKRSQVRTSKQGGAARLLSFRADPYMFYKEGSESLSVEKKEFENHHTRRSLVRLSLQTYCEPVTTSILPGVSSLLGQAIVGD